MKTKIISLFLLITFFAMPSFLSLHATESFYFAREQDFFLEKGVESFSEDRYGEALDYFDMVLRLSEKGTVHYGSALWGKAFCHTCLEDMDHLEEDLIDLAHYILPGSSCNECQEALLSFSANPHLELLQTAYFAEENQPISIDDCKRRVHGTFNAIKAILEKKLPTAADSLTRERFKQFATQLAIQGYKCCDAGTHWTECVRPLTDRWKAWKDRDLPPNPE